MVENKYFVTDAHCHIYPEKIASRAVAGTDNFYHEHSVGSGTVEGLMKMGYSFEPITPEAYGYHHNTLN